MESRRYVRMSVLVAAVGVLYLGAQLVALYGLAGVLGTLLSIAIVGLAFVVWRRFGSQ